MRTKKIYQILFPLSVINSYLSFGNLYGNLNTVAPPQKKQPRFNYVTISPVANKYKALFEKPLSQLFSFQCSIKWSAGLVFWIEGHMGPAYCPQILDTFVKWLWAKSSQNPHLTKSEEVASLFSKMLSSTTIFICLFFSPGTLSGEAGAYTNSTFLLSKNIYGFCSSQRCLLRRIKTKRRLC